MEETGITNPKYQPLRVLWHPFVQLRMMNHPFGTDSLVTRELVLLLCKESLTRRISKSADTLDSDSTLQYIYNIHEG